QDQIDAALDREADLLADELGVVGQHVHARERRAARGDALRHPVRVRVLDDAAQQFVADGEDLDGLHRGAFRAVRARGSSTRRTARRTAAVPRGPRSVMTASINARGVASYS